MVELELDDVVGRAEQIMHSLAWELRHVLMHSQAYVHGRDPPGPAEEADEGVARCSSPLANKGVIHTGRATRCDVRGAHLAVPLVHNAPATTAWCRLQFHLHLDNVLLDTSHTSWNITELHDVREDA